jgi:hypothetical protein
MRETPAASAASKEGVKGGTVSPFHALHGSAISTVLFRIQPFLRPMVTAIAEVRLETCVFRYPCAS